MWSINLIFKKKYILFLVQILTYYVLSYSSVALESSQWGEPINLLEDSLTHITQNNVSIKSVEIITKNQNLKRKIQKLLAKYEENIFSKKQMDQIHTNIIDFLINETVFLPSLKGPFFRIKEKHIFISYVIDNPYQYGFVIKGNTIARKQKLLPKDSYVTLFNNDDFIKKIILGIREFYLKHGYGSIELKYEENINEEQFKKVVYLDIEEGSVSTIHEIRISGRFSRSNEFYIDLLKKYGEDLIRRKIFYNRNIQESLKNLVNELRNEGYLKAEASFRVSEFARNRIIIDIFSG